MPTLTEILLAEVFGSLSTFFAATSLGMITAMIFIEGTMLSWVIAPILAGILITIGYRIHDWKYSTQN